MGSGTTGVACGSLGRRFIGMELDCEYFGVATNRILAMQNSARLGAQSLSALADDNRDAAKLTSGLLEMHDTLSRQLY
jgi:hypothetical protein